MMVMNSVASKVSTACHAHEVLAGGQETREGQFFR
jgi:hypothetical protein